MLKYYDAWEIKDFSAVLQKEHPQTFLAAFAAYVQDLIFEDLNLSTFYDPRSGCGDFVFRYDKETSPFETVQREWQEILETTDYYLLSQRGEEIVKRFRFFDSCCQRLENLHQGSLWRQICNYRKREVIRDTAQAYSIMLSGQDLFTVAIWVYCRNGWGTAEQFKQDIRLF